MRFEFSSFLTLALLALPALSAPAGEPKGPHGAKGPKGPKGPKPPGKPINQNACVNPQERKEWRQLTIPERLDFIRAVKCLHAIPATRNSEYPGTSTDYEAFSTQHKIQTPWVHYTGLFLPWHRLLLREYERSLQEKCNYAGALPYWDYTIDSGPGKNFTIESPVWDNVHGFGGNGAFDQTVHDELAAQGIPDFWGGGCVETGPFANFTFTVPQGRFFNESTSPRCLKRNFFLAFTEWTTQDKEDAVMQQTNFADMEFYLEGGSVPGEWAALHTGGHFIMGGLMPQGTYTTGGDVWTSNLEPVFYLHHANIDRVWNQWQIQNNNQYLWETGLSTAPRAPNVFGNDEDFGFIDAPVTQSTPVNLGPFGGPSNYVTVGQLLDTTGRGRTSPGGHKGVLCYKYSKSPKPVRSS